ncbi:MAG: hypothetical protein ACOY7U_01665 [Acidobacteriota bacterium]
MRHAWLVVLVGTAVAVAGEPSALEHRLWLLGKVRPGQVEQARQVGVDALVVPLAEAEARGGELSVKLTLPPDPGLLHGLPVWAAVWVSGEEVKKEAAEGFWNQLGPAVRGLGVPVKGLVLATRALPPGLLSLASELSRLAQMPVEVGAPAQDLLQQVKSESAKGVGLVAFALGNLAALGFPHVTPQDAAELLAAVDELGPSFRGAVVVANRVAPALPEGQNPWELVQGMDYQPTAEGDVLLARSTVTASGASLPAGTNVTLLAYDAARLQRDLGLLLRPVRQRLLGWDSVGELPPAPALGFTWEAFVAFLSGEGPAPRPVVKIQWESPTTLKVNLQNPTPFASAFATTGNFLDLTFSGTEVRDVTLLAGSGADFGKLAPGFVRAPRGAASVVRLYLKVVPPQSTVDVATVSFLSRPKEIGARCTVRLGDGREAGGPVPTQQGK